jgi:hypothetical protein
MFRNFASLTWVSAFAGLCAWSSPAAAGTVSGRLELPPAPPRPPSAAHGFLEALPNLLAKIRVTDPTPWMFVMLDAGTPMPAATKPVEIDIIGERFSQTLVPLPANAELVIKNASKNTRFLGISEAPQLLKKVPLNPTNTQSFRPEKAGDVYTIRDSDAPHLSATVVVTPSAWVAPVSSDGKFDFANVPEGKYTLKVYYKSGWIDKPDPDQVTVSASGKVELRSKIPPGFPVKPAKE